MVHVACCGLACATYCLLVVVAWFGLVWFGWQRYNDPPVNTHLSIHGPLVGVAALPSCQERDDVCQNIDALLAKVAYTAKMQDFLFQVGRLALWLLLLFANGWRCGLCLVMCMCLVVSCDVVCGVVCMNVCLVLFINIFKAKYSLASP